MPPSDRADYDRVLSTLRTRLREAAFAAAWGEGQAWSLEQAAGAAGAVSTGTAS